VWKLGYKLVEKGSKLNKPQIQFLIFSDPSYIENEKEVKRHKSGAVFATGMSVDDLVKSCKSWGINYFNERRLVNKLNGKTRSQKSSV